MSDGELRVPDAAGVQDRSIGTFIRDIIDPAEVPASQADHALRITKAAQPIATVHSASWPGLVVDAYTDLAAIEIDWKGFEPRADGTVFQTFDWLATWQRHIGSQRRIVPAIVLGRDADRAILFLLPLGIETRGFLRRLTWLGSDLCDYNAPLLAPGFAENGPSARFGSLWQDIVAMLRTRLRFDFVDLQKMPASIGARQNPFLDLQVLAHPSHAHVATLGRDWEAFYAAKRSASTRKRERRQRKQLEQFGNVRMVEVRDPPEVIRALDTLMAQKSRALAQMGAEDLFSRPGYRAFFHAVATHPAMRDVVQVTRLDVGSSPAALSVGLACRDCYSLVLSSYRDGEISRFGPGRAHLNELLRHAIERGFRLFDFTIGDEPYKRDWSDIELRIYDYLAPVTIKGSVAAAAATGFRRTKRLIKRTPILWRAFSKLRSLLGLRSDRMRAGLSPDVTESADGLESPLA
jgi:CelD/BcsL family acetyltransferase involved in cellulose biosynthesis